MTVRFYDRVRQMVDEALPASWTSTASAVLAPADLVVLIGRAMLSPEVPTKTKAILIVAGLYTSSGWDLIPEAVLGPIGYVDDGVVIIEALHRLLNETDQRVISSLWSGDPETLARIQSLLWRLRNTTLEYIVRPFARWLRQTLGAAVAGRAA